MVKELLQMFGFATNSNRHVPDPITAQVKIATQRNERAGEAARSLLREVLEKSDGRVQK